MGNSSFYTKNNRSKPPNSKGGPKSNNGKNGKGLNNGNSNPKNPNFKGSKRNFKGSKPNPKKPQERSRPNDSDSNSDSKSGKQSESFYSYSYSSSDFNGVPKDWWLYDTGSTQHISNDKSYFKDLTYCSDLDPVTTGAGFIKPVGKGTVTLPIKKKSDIFYLTLENTLYIPDFPINLISGLNHYKSGGKISGTELLSSKGVVIATLNPLKRGFFLDVAYKPEPNFAYITAKTALKKDLIGQKNGLKSLKSKDLPPKLHPPSCS